MFKQIINKIESLQITLFGLLFVGLGEVARNLSTPSYIGTFIFYLGIFFLIISTRNSLEKSSLFYRSKNVVVIFFITIILLYILTLSIPV